MYPCALDGEVLVRQCVFFPPEEWLGASDSSNRRNEGVKLVQVGGVGVELVL